MKIAIDSEDRMREFGKRLGGLLAGGEVLVLVGDVGAGKTTLTKGMALGLGIEEPVQSPTFTINRLYEARDGLTLAHYDFYRLSEPGIMSLELAETVADKNNITVLEWADIVEEVLPLEHLKIEIAPTVESGRNLTMTPSGQQAEKIVRSLA